jgi:ATP-dependent HslUV protease ATP-binding subunit HslU
MTFSHLKVKEI